MIEYAKYAGLTLYAMIFLAIPALLVLSIILKWGVVLNVLLTALVIVEIILIICAIESLVDDGIW